MELNRYTYLLKSLLPRGPLWEFLTHSTETLFYRILDGLAQELGRLHHRIDVLLREAFANTTEELIELWEEELGLTHSCSGMGNSTPTLAERRAQILAHLHAHGQGSLSKSYFLNLLATLSITYGFSVEIQEFTPFRVNYSSVESPLCDIEDWRNAWFLTLGGIGAPGAIPPYKEIIDCLINAHKPAHTFVFIIYRT